jgi:hypothetical protein
MTHELAETVKRILRKDIERKRVLCLKALSEGKPQLANEYKRQQRERERELEAIT